MNIIKNYHSINAANFRLDGGAMFGIIPRPMWSKKMPPDSDNRIDMSLRTLLIQTQVDNKKRNILIDTGIGDYHGEKFESRFDIRGTTSPLESGLSEINRDASSITDLILSHLHFDHVGGIARFDHDLNQYIDIFNNATIHLHKNHYEYALSPTPRDGGSFHQHIFDPIIKKADRENRIHWLSGEEGEIIPEIGLKFKCSHGHTPFMIHPYDENIIYMADLIPTSHHIQTAWVMGYDISPGITAVEKEDFLNFIVKNDLTMLFEHDPNLISSKLKENNNREKDNKKFIIINEVKEAQNSSVTKLTINDQFPC